MKKSFIGSCVDNPFRSVEALTDVIEKGQPISRRRFIRNTILDEDIIANMRYWINDYTYYLSGKIFFYEHSRIEYFYAKIEN